MGGAVKKLFGMETKKPPTIAQVPVPPAPEVKPIAQADADALDKARRGQAVAASQRGGRSSTILSDADESLGG
jgi:hypothetical protein